MPAITPREHVVRQLADISLGDEVKLVVSLKSGAVEVVGCIAALTPMETGVYAEIPVRFASGVEWRAVVVFCGSTNPAYIAGQAINGICMSHGFGDLVPKWLGFTGRNIPHHLKNGVYRAEPRGTVLVQDDKAIHFINGILGFHEGFDPVGVKGTYKVGDQGVKITNETPVPGVSADVVKKLPEGAIFLRLHDGSIHRRRDHGIEPITGDRTTLKSLTKDELVIPLTCPSRAIQVNDVYETDEVIAIVREVKANGNIVVFQEDKDADDEDEFIPGEITELAVKGSDDEFQQRRFNLRDGNQARRVTDSDWKFTEPTLVPFDFFAAGQTITIAGRTLTMVLNSVEPAFISATFVDENHQGTTVRFFKVSANQYSTYVRDMHVGPYAPVSLVNGALYAVTGRHNCESDALIFQDGALHNISLDMGRFTEGNPHTRRSVRFHTQANGKLACPSEYTYAYPHRMLAGPGFWHIDAEGRRPKVVILTEAAEMKVWRRTSDSVGFAHVTSPGDHTHINGLINVDVPFLATDWDVGAALPRAIMRIRNFVCQACNERLPRSSSYPVTSSTGASIRVCRSCTDNFPTCGTCNSRFPRESFRGSRCAYCSASGGVPLVNCYSYKPEPAFKGAGPLFYGTETELEMSGEDANRIQGSLLVRKIFPELIYAKTDGSIHNGLEFVTHPFSLGWFKENQARFKTMFAELSEIMEAKSNCGIHIHTSKAGYAVKLESIPEIDKSVKMTKERLITRGLLRTQKFVYGNPELVIHFAGRKSSYAKFDLNKNITKEIIAVSRNHTQSKSDRYAAMNFTKQTVEFRVFRSTTNFEEYARNILFVDSVIQYARSHAMPKKGAPSTLAYRKFLETNPDYAPLVLHYDAWGAKPKATAAAK